MRSGTYTAPITDGAQRAYHDLLFGARLDLGLSQRDVAEKTGIPQSVVSDMERSAYKGMSAIYLFMLLDFYQIEPNHVARILDLYSAEEQPADDIHFKRLYRMFLEIPQDIRSTCIDMAGSIWRVAKHNPEQIAQLAQQKKSPQREPGGVERETEGALRRIAEPMR